MMCAAGKPVIFVAAAGLIPTLPLTVLPVPFAFTAWPPTIAKLSAVPAVWACAEVAADSNTKPPPPSAGVAYFCATSKPPGS